MDSTQLTDLEARLTERGYKKWTKCLVGREDYAYFKSFALHKDKYGEDECDYQIAFRIRETQNYDETHDIFPNAKIWVIVTMLFSTDANRLDCDYSLQLDVPDIEMCEKMMAEIFQATKKYNW